MAIDYRLIGGGNTPRSNLMDAFRGGLQARGDMLQNQNIRESVLANQFANSRAPIVAAQNDEIYAQNLALKNAQEAQARNQVTLDNQKADRDFYDASLGKIGSVLYGVSSDKEIPLAIQHLESLKTAGVLHPKVYDNFAQMVANKPLTVDGARYLGTTALSLKDQLDRENKARDDAYTAKKDALQLAFDKNKWSQELGLKRGTLNETIRNNKEQNAIGWKNANKNTVSGKPLSGEASSKYAIGMALKNNLDELKLKMLTGDFKQNVINAQISGSDLNRLVSDATDLLGKKRSGAALNASEERLYQNLIANKYDAIFNNKQSFINQIDRLNKENKYFLNALTGNINENDENSFNSNKTEIQKQEQKTLGLNDADYQEYLNLGGNP